VRTGGLLPNSSRTAGFDAVDSEPSDQLVAALSASAGDLAALEKSFDYMPRDAGIALILADEITRAKEVLKRTGAENISSIGEKAVSSHGVRRYRLEQGLVN